MFPGNSTAVSFPAHWPEWDLGNTHVWKVAKKMGVEVAIQRSQSHCPARGLLLKRKYSSPYCLSHFRLRFLLLRAEKKILIVKRSKIFIPAYKILGESAPPSAFPIFSPFHSCWPPFPPYTWGVPSAWTTAIHSSNIFITSHYCCFPA